MRCLRCHRPASLCYCARLAPVATTTRVVFLQHPRERRVRIGTARMAYLGLANAELHLGVTFAANPRVQALATDPSARAALLFPGDGAHDPATLPGGRPATLVVVDGTWSQARKVLARNPALAALPRVGFALERPSRYRVRREPAPHCLSTVEAVVEALRRFEGDGGRFAPLLSAFEDMVATQLACAAERPRPYRRACGHGSRRTS